MWVPPRDRVHGCLNNSMVRSLRHPHQSLTFLVADFRLVTYLAAVLAAASTLASWLLIAGKAGAVGR